MCVPRVKACFTGCPSASKLKASESLALCLPLYSIWQRNTQNNQAKSAIQSAERNPLMLCQISPRKEKEDRKGGEKRGRGSFFSPRLDDNRVQTMICCSSTVKPLTDQRAAAARWVLHTMNCKFLAPERRLYVERETHTHSQIHTALHGERDWRLFFLHVALPPGG